MKEITISKKRQKTELILFLGCFIAAETINTAAIIGYDTRWSELFTHIGYVFFLAVCFYLVLLPVRYLIKGILRLLKKKNGPA